jgi:hypothetical protein
MMRDRNRIVMASLTAIAALASGSDRSARADPPAPKLTVESLLVPGPEAHQLARMVGTWDVTMTIRTSPKASPIVVTGMIAERTMVGLYLTETMKPAPSSKLPDFRRVDYLTYDPVQSRWDYCSMDTRAPIGIMFARSFASGPEKPGDDITVYFDTFPNPGIGDVGGGVRARHVDSHDGDARSFKRQYWTRAGDPEWLAIEYVYTRHK